MKYEKEISAYHKSLREDLDKEIGRYKLTENGSFILIIISCFIAVVILFHDLIFYFMGNDTQWLNNAWTLIIGGVAFLAISAQKFCDEALKGWLMSKQKHFDYRMSNLTETFGIIDQKIDYVLYLRDFEGGEVTSQMPISGTGPGGIANPAAWPTIHTGKYSTSHCLRYFSKKFPVVLLHNKREKTILPYEAHVLYCPDHIWFDVFDEVARTAKYVIIDFDVDQLTKNMQDELESIVRINKPNVIQVVKRKNPDVIEKLYPKLAGLTVCKVFTALKPAELDVPEQFEIDYSQFEKSMESL